MNFKSELTMQEMYEFCRKMPKCEFHAHLSGCISRKMLRILDERRRKRFGLELTAHDQSKLCEFDRTPKNLTEAFQLFPLIQQLIVVPKDVAEVTVEVIREFSEENVVYLELRSTPRQTNQMSKEDYVKALIAGVNRARILYPNICVRLLLSIDRRNSVEEAKETLNLAVKYACEAENNDKNDPANSTIIGVEISGDPNYDARKFLPLLNDVRGSLSVISFHLAEMEEHMDEIQECLQFGPSRIGHATFLHRLPDKEIRQICLNYLFNKKIPIEICLSSNLICGTIESVETSHLKYYYERNHPILISTDDRAMMNCSLTDEYMRVLEALNLNTEEIFKLSFSSVKYICGDKLNSNEKTMILNQFNNFANSQNISFECSNICSN